MSHFGLAAARRLQSLDPEAVRVLAEELRNAVTPAGAVAHELKNLATAMFSESDASSESSLLDCARSIKDTVNHIVQLAKMLEAPQDVPPVVLPREIREWEVEDEVEPTERIAGAPVMPIEWSKLGKLFERAGYKIIRSSNIVDGRREAAESPAPEWELDDE
jgi:hypothetical protein